MSSNRGMGKLFPSEEKATAALDKWVEHENSWKRCDEPVPPEEPKPLWVDDHGNKYTVQQINDRWEIWFYGNGDISRRSFNWAGDSESWPTEQDAIDVLDTWISMDSESSWKRCDDIEQRAGRWK